MKKIALFSLIIAFALASINLAKAATLYVNWDGTEDYTTIQAAIDAASPGDIILVAEGTYFENVVLKDGIELIGEGADMTVIDGGGYGHPVSIKYLNNVKIQGFTITNSGQSWTYVDGTVNAGVRILCSSVILTQNIIVDNFIGVYVNSWLQWADSEVSIINNTIVNNTYAVFSVETATQIINNIIVSNLVGIYDWSSFWGSSLFPPTISYNDVWGNYRNYLSDPGQNNISVYPLFIDVNEGDYHLQENSPCIDTGDPDILDEDGSRSDMGAFGGNFDESKSPEVLEVSINIDPNTLNLKSGIKYITVYIELPEGYDVNEIDISTLDLNNVQAESKPIEIEDIDNNGISDLMVKFNAQELIPLLNIGEEALTITGQLNDGILLEGSDLIQVINPGKKDIVLFINKEKIGVRP